MWGAFEAVDDPDIRRLERDPCPTRSAARRDSIRARGGSSLNTADNLRVLEGVLERLGVNEGALVALRAGRNRGRGDGVAKAGDGAIVGTKRKRPPA